MSEIAAIAKNGYSIVSTFSGCGGSCLGFKMAGFDVLWASEFIPAAQEVYRANHAGTILDTRDIRQVKPEDILRKIGREAGDIDVLEGSPPCASFSTAGKLEAGWGKVKAYSDTKQRVDDLFFEFARIVAGLKPRVFVAENVSGLVKGAAKGYFKEILGALKGSGYRVQSRLLDAQWLGVPQMRQRIIFVGVREDLDACPRFPKPLAYRYSVREALGIAFRPKSYAANDWNESDEPAAAIQASGQYFMERVVGIEDANGYSRHAFYETDRPMDTIQAQRPVRAAVQTHKGLRSIDEPSPSVLTHGRRHTTSELTLANEIETRRFSIAELKRICGFPDDFILTGTYAQQWERLGRAVPPVMMAHIARVVRDEILGAIDGKHAERLEAL
jgi:DNA (cytosine-5)-methyltransferase 1